MTFTQLNLPTQTVEHLKTLGFSTPKPIQIEAIPKVLSSDDVVVKAPTASGKTLIFAIASILKIDISLNAPQILLLAPTRELSLQISNEIRAVGKYIDNLKVTTLIGGEPLANQVVALQKKSHIVVATVGRLMDHLSRDTIDLSSIKMLVLDEADKMLDMGFRDDILKIGKAIRGKRQTLLFSATYSDKLQNLIESVTSHAINVEIAQSTQQLKEIAYEVHNKDHTMLSVLSHYQPSSTIIFANTKVEVDRLHQVLSRRGFEALAFHGDFNQKERDEIFIQFKNGSVPIIVATDIVSRGIDIEGVACIINYNIADKREVYTHRIGRSGRDGKEALAISLFTPNERFKLRDIVGKIEEDRLLEVTNTPIVASNQTVVILGGKRDKLRKGDIVGAICREFDIDDNLIGDITLNENRSYVAIDRSIKIRLNKIKIKKRNFKLFLL